MKQIFLKALKIFLVIAVILLVLALVFGVVLSLNWPWWVGLFVLIGLLGIVIGVLFLKKLWLRRREQQFVQEIIAQDNASIQKMDGRQKERSQDLQQRWQEAIDALRKSHLRKQGNPLYVLPWYLVIGESGSGKTTAIKGAQLSSPFAEVSRMTGISGTRNCDWWFFEQAIIIDTAGRYAIPVDEGADKEEWQKFLTQLARYRKKEPLNGLVVTVAADKLLSGGPEVLEDDGRKIRQRVDELMRVLGTKFPVYVMVTKGDLVQGMSQFCDRFQDKTLQQAMGLVNHNMSKDAIAVLRRAIGVIADRLRDLRLILFHKSDARAQGVDPALLLFPEEFEKLEPGLQAFFKGAFQENPYQETPLLRGVFFSSGRQEGTPYSHFLSALGLIQEKEVLPGTNKGLFLHDFFGRILPGDRGLFAPTQRAMEWNRLTKNLGLTSWVALGLAVCGILSFSFVKNLATLRSVSREFAKPPVLQGEVLSDVVIMDHFRQAIVNVENQNNNWWIPRLGLNESKAVEVGLKEKYCEQFRGGFLVPFDKAMADTMSRFSDATPGHVLGQHVAHLARRINLLKARLQGQAMESLYTMPQPSYAPITSMADQKVIPEIKKKFSELYLKHLEWQADQPGLNREMNALQTWLKHVLTLKGTDLRWVVDWINNEEGMASVTLEDFWGGGSHATEEVSVPAAFTVKGKAHIDGIVAEIESALVDPLVVAGKKLEFLGWYRKVYLDRWHTFAEGFSNGVDRLDGREERRQVAGKIGTDEGPYFALMETMADELDPVAEGEDVPTWVALVYKFRATKMAAIQDAALKEKGSLVKATRKGQALIARLEQKLSKAGAEKVLESQLAAVRGVGDYVSALGQIRPAAVSRSKAFDIAVQAFQDDPATSKSPVYTAQDGLETLTTHLAGGEAGQKMFWALVGGPLDYLWLYVRMEAACHLQDLWEKEVLVELQGLGDQKAATSLLLGDDGYATKFAKGPAAPFLGRSLKKGYYAKQCLGKGIPFQESFLSFLTKGAKAAKPIQGKYSVSIQGLPTDTNKGAQLKAHATRLEMHCAKETQTLVNLNYPVSKTFDWSAQDCGDVLFKIEVGKLVLTKKYTGYQAFPEFLKDFRNGLHTFYPGSFPREEAALKRLGIESITVKYRFKGHEPVLKLLGTAPGRAPRSIVTCWDQ